MFVYPAYESPGGPSEMWRQIGIPEEQIARDSSAQRSLIEILDGFAAVRREYASPDVPGTNTAPAHDDPRAEAETIRGLEATWRAALTAKDTASIRRFYAEGGYYLPQWSTGYAGPDAIADRWAGEITGGDFRLEREPKTIEVSDACDMAYEVGTYEVAWSKPAEGRIGGGTGNYVTVWKKAGGRWKTAAYIWNQDAQR
jgi:ketosteroid isomerase-like protein